MRYSLVFEHMSIFKTRKIRIDYFSIFFLIFSLICNFSLAYPTAEKSPAGGVFPLDLLSSTPTVVFTPISGDYKDRFIFTASSSSLTIIDTLTWDEYTTQPDSFSSEITSLDILPDGKTLIVALSSGDIASIDLSDADTFNNTSDDNLTDDSEEEQDSREADLSSSMTSAGIDDIVADPTSGSEILYMINSDDGYYYEYNIETSALSEVELIPSSNDEDTSTTYTPQKIVYAESSYGDYILITTGEGVLLVTAATGSSFSEIELSVRDDDTSAPTLSDITLSPNHDYAYIIDETNDLIWVYAIGSSSFIDQITSDTSLDPIEFDPDDENTSLASLTSFTDENDENYIYVAGANGVSIIDANSPDSTDTSKLEDTDTSTSDIFDPITLSATPEQLLSSSTDDSYIYSFNGDASISVITDNPAITMSSDATTVTESSSSFTLTFQSDTTGSYSIRVNSSPDQTDGTELVASTNLLTVDTDTTTAIDINDFDRSIFSEGTNIITLFLTDGNSKTGRGGTSLTVDRPPEAVTISSTSFGNNAIYYTFEQSSDEDIAYYTIYAEPAESQSNPSCPGTLTFTSSATLSATITPSQCDGDPCSGKMTGLTNDTTYCVAMMATDEAGQDGTLSTFSTSVTPEATVGPAAFLGETGCQLNPKAKPEKTPLLICLFTLTLFLLLRFKNKIIKPLLILFFTLLISFHSYAAESSPQNFSLEVKAAMWLPMNSDVKDFVGMCCNPVGEVEFGWLYKNRYNFTISTGFSYSKGSAIGITSGQSSSDKFTLMTIPIRLDFIYRHDYKENQLFVPYARVGADSVIFFEKDPNQTIKGNKFGLHGALGIGILLDRIEGMSSNLENDMGVNDVYLTIEGRYSYIRNFSSTGLDLSGIYPYVGVLFEF